MPETVDKVDKMFNRKLEIAEFYYENLEFVAEMCADRSNNCIRYFQMQYSFKMLFTGMHNSSLPCDIRSAFSKLMTSLYIDRYPHERILSVRSPFFLESDMATIIFKGVKLRSFDCNSLETEADTMQQDDHLHSIYIPEAKRNVREYFKKMTADKFLLVRDFVANFFVENEHVDIANQPFLSLQSSILDMLHELLDYGFFDSMDSLRRIAEPLVKVLDSRPLVEAGDDGNVGGGSATMTTNTVNFDDEDIMGDPNRFRHRRRSSTNTRNGARDDSQSVDDDGGDGAIFAAHSGHRRKSRRASSVSDSRTMKEARSTRNEMLCKESGDPLVIAFELEKAPEVLPEHKLTNTNWHIQEMKVKLCTILKLISSLNEESILADIMKSLSLNQTSIRQFSSSRRRSSIMLQSRKKANTQLFNKKELDAFNASYHKYYGDVNIVALGDRVKNLLAAHPVFTTGAKIHPTAEESQLDDWSPDSNGSNPLVRLFVRVSSQSKNLVDFNDIIKRTFSKSKFKCTDHPVDEIYIDLLMHEKPELFEAALGLLCQHYFMKKTVYNDLKVITVVGTMQNELNAMLMAQMRQLGNDTTSFELWKDTFNKNAESPGLELEARHSKNFARSVQTLSFISRLCGIYGGFSMPTGSEIPVESALSDIGDLSFAAELFNKELYGLDTAKSNVSVYWHFLFQSCASASTSEGHHLPTMLGVSEDVTEDHKDVALVEDDKFVVFNKLIRVHNCVDVCMRIVDVPFDEGSVESDLCGGCKLAIPQPHYVIHMGKNDVFSQTFPCPCPHPNCKTTTVLKKSHTELFALKRRVFMTLEHLALADPVTRVRIAEKLPLIESVMFDGLGSFRTFFAVASSPAEIKKVTSHQLLRVMKVIEKHYLAEDYQTVTLALRYLRMLVRYRPNKTTEVLRLFCEYTCVGTPANFRGFLKKGCHATNSELRIMVKNNTIDIDSVQKRIPLLQVHTLSFLFLSETCKGRSIANEVRVQELLGLDFLVSVICDSDEVSDVLPFYNGFKLAAARCLIGAYFTTSIPIPGLNVRPNMPPMFNQLSKTIELFRIEEKRGASVSVEGTDLLQQHSLNSRALATRFWIYKGVLPLLASFFSADGLWDSREANGPLKAAHKQMDKQVGELYKDDRGKADHSQSWQSVARDLNLKRHDEDGEHDQNVGAFNLLEVKTDFDKATNADLKEHDYKAPKKSELQDTYSSFMSGLEMEGSVLQELFYADEICLAQTLLGDAFSDEIEGEEGDEGVDGERVEQSANESVGEEKAVEGGAFISGGGTFVAGGNVTPSPLVKSRKLGGTVQGHSPAGTVSWGNQNQLLADASEQVDEEEEAGDEDEVEVTFHDIAGRMVRYIENNLAKQHAGQVMSQTCFDTCVMNLTLLQRVFEIVADPNRSVGQGEGEGGSEAQGEIGKVFYRRNFARTDCAVSTLSTRLFARLLTLSQASLTSAWSAFRTLWAGSTPWPSARTSLLRFLTRRLPRGRSF